jgi:hypothetical protein
VYCNTGEPWACLSAVWKELFGKRYNKIPKRESIHGAWDPEAKEAFETEGKNESGWLEV